jgi:hypothetical protein
VCAARFLSLVLQATMYVNSGFRTRHEMRQMQPNQTGSSGVLPYGSPAHAYASPCLSHCFTQQNYCGWSYALPAVSSPLHRLPKITTVAAPSSSPLVRSPSQSLACAPCRCR